MNYKSIFLVGFIIFSLFFSCTKDKPEDEKPPNTNNTTQAKPLYYEINDFIWHGLSDWYLWVDEVKNLDPNTFDNSQAKLDKFLLSENDSEKFFDNLLYESKDRFSLIVDDYNDLEKSFQGIRVSTGMKYSLYALEDNHTVRGYVRYIVKGSPAEDAGVKRGDIFTHVGGKQINRGNYRSLLNSSASSLTFTFLNGEKTITQKEIKENPVYLVKVINTGGKKIGYFMFNGFTTGYKEELNDALGELANANIDELVLDFRYNGGGLVSMAVQLASSIAGTKNVGKVMAKSRYNAEINKAYIEHYGSEALIDRFTDSIDDSTPIHMLNVTRLFVLVTGNSASASELVINSLKPYMDVHLIGKKTYGKNVGSITLYDSDTYSKSHATLNKKHKWAMQPIVVISENSVGFSDYTNGFSVDDKVDEFEYLKTNNTLLPLGDPTEPLLAKAIERITGVSPSAQASAHKYRKYLHLDQTNSIQLEVDDMPNSLNNTMYIDVEDIPLKLRKKLIPNNF